MLLAGHGIEDRLAARLDRRRAPRAVPRGHRCPLRIDLAEDRLVHLFERRGENVEDRRAGLGVLSGEDAQQRLALRRVARSSMMTAASPLPSCIGPGHLKMPATLSPSSSRVAVMAAVDLDADDGPAIAVCRQAVELARAAIGAIAVGEFPRPDRPLDVGHCDLPCLRRGHSALIVGSWDIDDELTLALARY